MSLVVDCHYSLASVSRDEGHDVVLGLHGRELAALEDRAAAQKAVLDRQQLLIEDQIDLLDDQADQIVDLDRRMRALEGKVCEEKTR
jgi:hypothetical protein